MAGKKLWDKYEVAILIDGYIKVKAGENKSKIIENISEVLRNLAINRGIEIDESYRNFNGIFMQMEGIRSLFGDSNCKMNHVSKLFNEMVELYNNDSNAFSAILEEANELINNSNTVKKSNFVKNALFDKYETAILLDYYIKCESRLLSKKQAISKASVELRMLGKCRNIVIDDSYRNEQGITHQFGCMESAYKRYTVSKPASKLFKEIVKLYREDIESFNLLLKEARQMINEEPKGDFFSWLASKVTTAQLSKYRIAFERVEEYCISENMISNSLFEIEDKDEIKKIEKDIMQNNYFRWINRNYFNTICAFLKYFINYLNERNDIGNTVLGASVENYNEISNDILKISFDENINLAYTKPVYAAYFGDEIKNATSWKQVYVGIVKEFYSDYSKILPINKPFNNKNKRMDLCTDEYISLMITPKKIADGIYLETNYSANDIVRKIKVFAEICLVDMENIDIKYRKNDSKIDTTTEKISQKEECDESLYEVDFNSLKKMNYTKPVYVSYFDEEIKNISSWRSVYVELFKKIYEDYSNKIFVNRPLNNKKVYLYDNGSLFNLVNPAEIKKGLYIETNYSATDIIKQIKTLLRYCLVDEENVVIKYKKNFDSKVEEPESMNTKTFIRENKKENTDYESSPVTVKKAKIFDKLIEKSRNIEKVDFNNLSNYTYTEPVFLSYYDEKIKNISSWKRVYVELFKRFYRDYNEQFQEGAPANSYLFPEEYTAIMIEPKEVAKGVFIEVNYSCSNIVKEIKKLMDVCSINNNNVVIKYKKYKKIEKTEKESENMIIKKEEVFTSKKLNDRQETASIVPSREISKEVNKFKFILEENFSKGFRLKSKIECKRFKNYWNEFYHSEILMDDDEIINNIEKIGITYGDKVYITSKMLDESMKKKVFSFISENFSSGKQVIFYENIFNEFEEDFFDYCMYDSGMLKEYLKYENDGTYFINDKYISNQSNVKISILDEIKKCIIDQFSPMTYDEIYKKLAHIPENKIKSILRQNKEFISNGKNEYFHIDIISFEDDEIYEIEHIITQAINEKQFITGSELIKTLRKKQMHIIENNIGISDIGLRDAIGFKLNDKFSFSGNIISNKNHPISTTEIFLEFCKSKDSFTLDELKSLKLELNTIINFDVIYRICFRVSKDEFVSKKFASFNVEETDNAIDGFCTGKYIAIGKVDQFSIFPDAVYKWNSYLLEQYVAMFSAKYKLLHATYNESSCVGAIVKRSSNIETWDDLLINILADSGISLKKEEALEYLYEEGYLAQKRYAGIEKVLVKANEMRNQKGL